ncbi:MAG TPA: CBS domain-containing protein [Dehalococcoidia bacterium]|nr:CBS domain-containing protein [Dehalococcoidia bacterium]
MKIRDLLKIKGRQVVTIGPNETVVVAVQKLIEHDRGSIPVCSEKGELVGIITERDIVRKCFVRSQALASIKIEDVMTKEVAIGAPEDDLDYAISVMKQKRIRHLPILDNQKVVGMVSMRDLLDVQLGETRAEIRYAGLLPKRSPRHFV